MAQQPNIEITPADRPRATLEPAPARLGRMRPGMITSPDEVPRGGQFGTPGPDTGWALRIISRADIPERSERLEKLLAALMSARASHYGRAPVPVDLEVALAVCGLGPVRSDTLDDRRSRWLGALAHEKSPGRTAVGDVGDDLYLDLDAVTARLRG